MRLCSANELLGRAHLPSEVSQRTSFKTPPTSRLGLTYTAWVTTNISGMVNSKRYVTVLTLDGVKVKSATDVTTSLQHVKPSCRSPEPLKQPTQLLAPKFSRLSNSSLPRVRP